MLYCFYKWLQFLKNHGLSVGFAAIIVDVMIIMGCVNGKTVPEPPHHSSVIYVDKLGERHQAPAQEQTANGHHKQHHHGNGTTQNDHRNGTTQTQKSRNSTKPSQRVPKWKARFDPRVTAKYDIKALIGKGSFSFVVRVENKLTKEPFAIKMIDRIQGKELFDSELNVLRRVRHMYIIQLTEVFESKEKIYMVMQLATGGELFDRIIAKGSFTERDATNVLSMMLDGLQYLHGLGITHRDLKPENLLYYHPGHDSKILITDFGLSACRKAGENYMMHTTCGTPEYIGPEILARKPYTSKVDMWAVGVITYILLSGTMPFDDENKARLYRMILKVRYNFDGEVSINNLPTYYFVLICHMTSFTLCKCYFPKYHHCP